MDVRGKLVELLAPTSLDFEQAVEVADHLAKNGVTVQEWISVTDRLPEANGKYLVCTNRGNVYQTKFYSYPEQTGGHWGQKDKGKSITHWMPLPQPPKGD